MVYVEQKVCLTTDADAARAAARDSIRVHMTLPNYTNNWLRLGFNISDFEEGGSDRLLDAVIAWGTEDQIRARLQEHIDAGADQVVIQTILPEGGRSVDWQALKMFAPG